MGCCQSRVLRQCPPKEAEALIQPVEQSLGFWKVSAEEVRLRLINYWPRSVVSKRVIQRMLERQEVSGLEEKIKQGTLAEFFNLMREGMDYPIQRLVLLAVLLSGDSDRVKAGVLFATYHSSEGKCMNQTELSELVNHALQLTTIHLLSYVQNELEEAGDTSGAQMISKYIAVLLHGRGFAVSVLVRFIHSVKELTEAEFIAKLVTPPGDSLCSAERLRALCYQLAVQKKMKTLELEASLIEKDEVDKEGGALVMGQHVVPNGNEKKPRDGESK